MKKVLYSLALFCAISLSAQAQSEKLTREQILSMSTDQLSELPLDQLMEAVETLGVTSVDELFALIMNKNVSSASKEEENAFTSPLSSTVITHDEIRTYGCSTIEEALRLVPGMVVAEKLNGVYDVQMRGLNNIPDHNMILYSECMNILVMIDGRVAHSYAIGTPSLDNLPISIEDIERIEVVRGATSALYGPNAVQGVINIITTKPNESRTKVAGNMQVGSNAVQGDVAFRRSFNSKLAMGLTYNINRRWRWTDELTLIPVGAPTDLSTLGSESQQIGSKFLCYDLPGVRRGSLSMEQFVSGLQNGRVVDVSAGANIKCDDLKYYYTLAGSNESGMVFSLAGGENPSEFYDNVSMSRRNDGINGYISLTPAKDVRINLTGGYQYAKLLNTQVGQDNVAFRVREFSTGYVALDADIKNLKLLANYSAGCNHFCVGAPGFQMYQKLAQVSAEYTVKVGDLAIKPALGYKKMFIEDHKPEFIDYGDGRGAVETSGFWGYYSEGNKTAENDDVEGSLRLDYKHKGLRLMGGVRFDKTSIPNDWNPSWQFVASYQLNDKNFLRVNYGHARRSTVFFHSSSNYNWHNSGAPEYIQFLGNEDAPLVKIDNFELGYRFKPVDRLLIDFESYYSISSDYGVLKAHSAMLTLAESDLSNMLAGVMQILLADPSQLSSAMGGIASKLGTKGFIQYGNMPFKVYQKGISMNVDWIISPKIIAKLNANVQQTKIDDYYVYDQTSMFKKQFGACQQNFAALLQDLVGGVVKTMKTGGNPQEYMQACLGYTPVAKAEAAYKAMSADEKAAYEQKLLQMYENGQTEPGVERPLGLYYALKYGVRYSNDIKKEYYIGADDVENPGDKKENRQDGVKHKATPSVFGSLGLIYRPIDKLTLSAVGYFSGKRSVNTTFGDKEVDGYFTMNLRAGYKPSENVEVFFNGHNLLNSNKQEFAYTDKIKGVYTVGVNFGF